MTQNQIDTCLRSTGAAKYALTKVSGRDQFVLLFHRSVDGENIVCRTLAGNDIYRRPRQLKALTADQVAKLDKLRGSRWLIDAGANATTVIDGD